MRASGGLQTARLLAVCLVLSGCAGPGPANRGAEQTVPAADPANAVYEIDGEQVTLTAGRSSVVPCPDGESHTGTVIFGEPVTGDLDEDGDPDAALLLSRATGGTGTFYYAAAAIARPQGWTGTNGVWIGDRIRPRSLTLRHGVVIVDFLDHQEGQPMAVPPTMERSKYFVLDGDRLVEIGLEDEDLIVAGEVRIDPQGRWLRPCGSSGRSRLLGSLPVLTKILAAYDTDTPQEDPAAAPPLMILTGRFAEGPAESAQPMGETFHARRLVKVLPGKSCAD